MRGRFYSGIPVLVVMFGLAAGTPVAGSAQSLDEIVAAAVRPLPLDLRAGATVMRYDEVTGEREVLREGTNQVECSPADASGFTRCYPRAMAARRDLQARLRADGRSAEEVDRATRKAVADGLIEPVRSGSLAYRLSEDDDRIRLLWMVLVPFATADELAAPTTGQRDASLIGRGTPWLMNEGTASAHLMIPINGTDRSNQGPPEPREGSTASDPIAQATSLLPDGLAQTATVSRFDPDTNRRVVLRHGESTVECRPRNPETGYTRCYHASVWEGRDLAARLEGDGLDDAAIAAAMAEARADGRIAPTVMGSLAYRLYESDDRIRLLWMVRVPGATSEQLGMPTGSQRDAALEGRGTPWMMNEGTQGAHLMIPVNATSLSNR